MRKGQRAMVCMLVQWAICLCFLQVQAQYLASLDNARAEGAAVFAVEVAADTPVPSESVSPAPPTPAATASPPPDMALQVEVLTEPTTPAPSARILIYHTHTWEAYRPVDGATYRETEKWRTKDNAHNVVSVGKALAANLTALGFTVTHDTNAFEPPDLSSAYNRSLDMLESRAAAGETYDLYIDLHRDAISASSTIRRTVNIGGESVARFMVLVGQGTTGGYDVTPDWQANYVLAQRITEALNAQHDGLARDVKVKTGRFNQHIAPCCILIECGVNTNTHAEVLRGIPYLAEAIAKALAP